MMSAGSSVLPLGSSIKFNWLFNKRTDLLFFYSSIFLGVLCYCLLQNTQVSNSLLSMVLISNAFGAGPFHFGATWFPYFDRQNFQHFWQDPLKRKVFFWAPPAILAISIGAFFICVPLITFIWLVWTIQHIVQQNVGILLLYHRYQEGEAMVDRGIEVRSQQLSAVFFSLMFFHRIMMNGLLSPLMNILELIALIAAVLAIRLYIVSLCKQLQSGCSLNLSAFSFWLFSVFCMAPAAFIGKDYAQAFIIPLTVHWFQYLAINYVLVNRKYSHQSNLSQNLPVSHPLLLFLAVCGITLAVVFIVTVISHQCSPGTIMYNLFGGFVMAIGLIHYFLDAFLWRFRDPFLRQTVLPFLKIPTAA